MIIVVNNYYFVLLSVIVNINTLKFKSLTLTDTVKSLSLDLFVFVHQSHRPSSQKRRSKCS